MSITRYYTLQRLIKYRSALEAARVVGAHGEVLAVQVFQPGQDVAPAGVEMVTHLVHDQLIVPVEQVAQLGKHAFAA